MKGVLAVAAHARPFIVQAVHEQFDITESRTAPRWGDATETGVSQGAARDSIHPLARDSIQPPLTPGEQHAARDEERRRRR